MKLTLCSFASTKNHSAHKGKNTMQKISDRENRSISERRWAVHSAQSFPKVSSWMNVNYFTSFRTTRPRLHKVRAVSNFPSWAVFKTFLASLCSLLKKHPRRCVSCVFISSRIQDLVCSSQASKTSFLSCSFRALKHPRHCVSYVFKMEPRALT
jgi:hypothetical protein